MTFTEREQKLIEFVSLHHCTQKRKYTNEPYVVHLIAVAKTVQHLGSIAVAIALCHDLVEDVEDFNLRMLSKALEYFGYSPEEIALIVLGVHELTDFYTKKLFPGLNRKTRHELEGIRLSKISVTAQSVKYADIIDNIKSIAEHDLDFAVVYLEEKKFLLKHISSGDSELYDSCKKAIEISTKRVEQFQNEIAEKKLLKQKNSVQK
jgi:(p)ppGpp synthase/HD superfamily hydrolase